MIKKGIISAVILFAAYNLYLAYGRPTPGVGQHQWQKNMILMQDYADFHAGDPVVIVGTSLSARLYNYMLPGGYYNLALAGESVFEGLSLVKQSPVKPKYLLIEANLFYKDPDKEATEGVFNPLSRQLRKILPAFREENQPASLLPPLLGKMPKNEKADKAAGDTGIANMLLQQRIKEYSAAPDSAAMERNIRLLKQYIDDLQAQGVKVVLYEIPEHCKLYETVRFKMPKAKIDAVLPRDKYRWMEAADCSAYTYSDGSHMAYESAEKFVRWFVKAFDKVK